jgi:telomerase protein component 1
MLNFRPELTSAIEIFATKCNWLSYSNPFPLQIVQHGQLEALKVIVANSGNYHSRVGYFQYDGWNLIEYACLYRQLQILEFFISSKVVPSTKALNLAVRNQWIEGVSVLLKANVVLDNRQEHDDTTLHSAVRTGNEEIVKLLLDAPNGNKMLQMFNSFGMAPLHVAADKLKFEIVKILLERGANANLKNSKTDHTPVHYVCTVTTDQGMPTRIALVDLLVQHGADLTLTCVTQFGKQSVVELACASDSLVTHLILNGAPKMSIAEINRKREEARKRLGQICMFEDAVPSECAIEENLVYGNFQHSGVQSHGEIKESHSSKSSGVHFTQTIIPWRTIRLFLSSTFLDMQAEREYLIKRVIPKVKERLAAQKIQLIEIDLRWGVTEEEIQSGSGLEVCLSGEKNSDLFCGILGSRYGWVPSPKQITDTVRYEYVWEDGKSITEMEINEGAFRRLDGKARSFFFFRDSAVRFPDQVKSIYEESNPTYTSQLTQLKETIKRSGYPVFEYRPRVAVASSGTSLTELEDLGAQFERHILATVKTLYPENQQVITDPLLLEREYHSGFVELRSSGFIGRTQLVSDIKSMIEGSFEGSCPPVVISGEAGSGKSSLVAKLTHDLLQENSIHELFIVYHFIGGSPSSVSIRNTLHRICSELVRAFELHIEVQEEFDGLVTQFQSVLESIANRNQKRVLIILDALNQLDYSNQSHTLHWLPQNFPNGITALVSCLPSDCLNVLEQRKIPTHIHLPVLSKENCQEIVSQTLARYKKKFTGHQLETILSKSGAVNPLYLTIVCEEFRVFGDFSKLDQKLNQLAQDVPGLLDQVLARMELDHGREIVANCLGLLECGRFGLLEEELLAITKLSRYQWGEIFLSLKFFLRPIGSSDSEKVLDFFHRQISKAVHRRYFENNPDLQKRIHSDLGLFFLEKISPSTNASNGWKLNFVQDYARGYSEVIYHLFHAQEYAGVSVLLSSLKFIEKKCTLGFTYGLVEDYLLFNTATHLDKKLGILVNPYMDFVLGNTHVFDRYPYVVLQMALNEPGKSPLCDIARKELARQAKSRPTPLFIWENKPLTPKNQQQFKSLNIGARTNCALGSPDGKLIATGDINGSVKVYSASTAELQGILISAPTRINSISFSADGKYLAGGAGSVLYFWEITTKLLIYQISHDILNEILGVHFNPISSGANYSIVACGNGFVKFDVNLSTRSHSVQSLPSEHTGMVTCCSFSHDGNRLLSGSADKKVVLYNNLSGKIQTTVFTGHSKLVKVGITSTTTFFWYSDICLGLCFCSFW